MKTERVIKGDDENYAALAEIPATFVKQRAVSDAEQVANAASMEYRRPHLRLGPDGEAIGDRKRNHSKASITADECACKILDAIGEPPDPQVALLLLRHCCSFGKLVYSIIFI